MNIIEELLQGVPLPRMVKVHQKFDAPEIQDVAGAVHQAVRDADVLSRINEATAWRLP